MTVHSPIIPVESTKSWFALTQSVTFCSCGVIPLIAAMLVAGVPLAPVMAFWIASPIMDPEMFVLTAAGIGYLWFGKELGGKEDGDTAAPAFRTRIRELAALAQDERAAIMCAEEDPMRCHRKHLLEKPLTQHGIELMHIRGDGSLIADATLNAGKAAQLSLFTEG